MALCIVGRCGNCRSITSRRAGTVYQCRACLANGVKPAEPKAKAKTSNDLPRHIEDALAGARYVMRSPDGEGFPRVVASIPDFGSVMLGGEGGEDLVERIERTWPDLNDVQLRRVVKYIDAGAAATVRAMTERPGKPKKRWVMDY